MFFIKNKFVQSKNTVNVKLNKKSYDFFMLILKDCSFVLHFQSVG